jgi:predicted nucleic acid-binding protein
MIVVDVNVIAYLLIQGDKTASAQQVYQNDPEWHVPILWRHEFLNVLATYVRHGGGKITDAEMLWQQGLSLLSSREHSVEMIDALRLATQYSISAYDAQYISLANAIGTPCITEDQRLQKAFPNIAYSMSQFIEG